MNTPISNNMTSNIHQSSPSNLSLYSSINPFDNYDQCSNKDQNNDNNITDDWKNNYEIFSLMTSSQNGNACEKIKNLICSRRYDLIMYCIEEFNNITLAELDKSEVIKDFTVTELLFSEAPTAVILRIINVRAKNNFNGENNLTCIKILRYLLDSNLNFDDDILIPLFELVQVFYQQNSHTRMFNLLMNHITTSNISNYLDLLKHIMFTYVMDYPETIALFNNETYDCNLLIKLLMILDCDNDTNPKVRDINIIAKDIITIAISKKSGNLNTVDKNGNTILTNCLQDYSIKKIMYLVELGCNPLIKNPITGENTMDLVQSQINRLKKENNTEYYYYKMVKSYFNLCNFKNTPKIQNQPINNNSNDKHSTLKWFYTNYCKPSNQ